MTRGLLFFAALAIAASLAALGRPAGDLLQRVPPAAAKRRNPFAGSEPDRRAGAKLFRQECAACHGRDAKGIGKAPPLTNPLVRQADPGKLFWILQNGSLRRGMPSFSHLPDEERWQIVTYLKSL
ncbi:MAG TPA: cytochrome c [Bryobacteraceae bacterium]|jgi:mono/diheme cytochrome c family protein|nr:cytochrome c [Bryobacteraceae bacterium]